MESIAKLFEALDALKQQIADAQAALAAEKAVGFAEGAASRDEEVAALKARIVELEAGVDPEKKFSQADLDAAVSAAVSPLQQRIGELEVLVAGIDGKVAEAVAAFKSELLAKYEEQQVAENEGETGFKNLLRGE